MKRNLLYGAALAFGVASLFSGSVFAEDSGFCIEDVCYPDLVEAVNAVPTDGTETTIKFVSEETAMTGSGVSVKAGQNIIFDFDGHSYQVTKDPAGSTGTKNQTFQLLKGSTVYMKNGTVLPNDSLSIKFFIQNYSDLTLDSMVLDATGSTTVKYVISNNFGKMTVTGDTVITAPAGLQAFDVWYGMESVYDDGIAVLFDENFTGSVSGKIEYGHNARVTDEQAWEKSTITIKAGDFTNMDGFYDGATGEYLFALDLSLKDLGIKIYGGIYTDLFDAWVADGYYIDLTNPEYIEVKKVPVVDGDLEEDWKLSIIGSNLTGLITDQIGEEAVSEIETYGTLAGGYLVGLFNGLNSPITELEAGKKVTLTFNVFEGIPAVAKGYARTFSVIRGHDVDGGTIIEEIPSTYSAADNTITVETDKFSFFAIVYNDVKVEENPDTADDIVSFITLAIASVAGVALLAVAAKRKA